MARLIGAERGQAFNGSGVSKAALTTEPVVFYWGSDIGFEVVSGMSAPCPIPGADLLGLPPDFRRRGFILARTRKFSLVKTA